MAVDLHGRSFLKLLDFTKEEILHLLELSARLKEHKRDGREEQYLRGKNFALIFEKTSTRTRCAFEVASYDQGAHVSYLGPWGTQIGHKESIKDTARVLGRMYDGIEYRGFGQATAEELGRHGVPVWNGLTDEYHPTQVLADLLTMEEFSELPLSEISLCYVGDGRGNMGDSLMVGAAKMGLDFRMAAPDTLHPDTALIARCHNIAQENGGRLEITADLPTALAAADFVYTDVWVSMGEPESAWAERIELLRPFQVNEELLALTGNPAVKFMHCLPAFHNRETEIGERIYRQYGLDAMEVTDEVFESDASIVFAQAENRLHTIKAVLVATLED